MSFPPADIDPRYPSFVAVLRARAQAPDGEGGFTFLGVDDGDEARLGYGDLDRKARAIAARLQAEGLAGERALLVYPPGVDFLPAFFGCLYAGVVAVPAFPPRPHRPSPRLRGIAADARPRAILSTAALLADSGRWVEGIPDLLGCSRVATDAVEDGRADTWIDPGPGPETLALLQYTSGSTASPKGVMITHGNLLSNSATIRRSFGSGPGTVGVSWLPLYHDMGLIGVVLQTLYCGGSSTLLSPVSFLQRPFRWLDAISRTGATISGGPNFAFDLCTRKVTAEQRDTLDLSRWSVAFNGAEPIHAETIERFAEAFAPCGFRREAFLPCYGLAEATLLVSGGPPAAAPVVLELDSAALGRGELVAPGSDGEGIRKLVGSGQVGRDATVAIVDPELATRSPDGRIGEIWVAGPAVAQGYWGHPEPTDRAFGAVLADSGAGPFLRTGDLGFLRDGELFVTGRLKDLIIVRGRNIYPQDVEWTVGRCHPSIRPEAGAAFSVEHGGEERLVVVQEVERRGRDGEAMIAAIRAAVAAEHDLDLHAVVLLRPMTLPKTSSGKVQRHATRDAYRDGTLEVVASWAAEDRGPRDLPATSAAEVPHPDRPAAEVAAWLAAKLAGPLGLAPEEVDRRRPFAGFGLGSLRAVELAGELEAWLGRSLAPTLLYDYPTIDALAHHLAGELGEPRPDLGPATSAAVAVDDRVAIIGVGCRFPGADGPGAFWRLLVDGVDAVGAVPGPRRADFRAPATTRAGFLDRVDLFDADFFGIAPREAAQVDPQHRLLLEVAWEALEDAGQVADHLAGGRVGVFVGISTNDYGRLLGRSGATGDGYALTGNAASIAANRLSYAFDFRGPSLAVDTACSSSLVAVQLACKSLAGGESDLALAGGVNLILAPEILANFEAAGFLSPDGRCKSFDARADGYVRGEGAGVVVLKPLAAAIAAGDPILAVIRGGAVNQDGRSNGLTAPSGDAQESVIRAACRAAGVDPGRIAYVEAHGTGTLLGDPIEARALGAALGEGREPGGRCLVGSAKTNVGHLEAAAGIAGLIKVALALEHRSIPPNLHFRDPNPHIAFDRLGLDVPRELLAWPEGPGPRLAGVSSFGFGGTNAHLVLESFDAVVDANEVTAPTAARAAHLLPISARSPAALIALAGRFAGLLAAGSPLADVATAAAVRRSHHDHRLAVVSGSAAEAIGQLRSFAAGEVRAGVASGRLVPGRVPRTAFVFSGQGVGWPGMGLDLLRDEPVFREAFAEVDRQIAGLAGWSAREVLTAKPPSDRLADPEYAQPIQFALQVALAALWGSWGIRPDAVVGHSLGEVAAAHVAGALGLAEAARLVVLRGRLTQRANGQGKTVAVGLSADEASRLVADSGGRLALAASNGPTTSALSGDPDAVADLVERLESAGVFARVLDADVAFHGPQMDPLRLDLERALADLRPVACEIPLFSTVTGGPVDGRALDAAYWGRNLRETVRFSGAVGRLVDGGHDIFVEIGPHPALAGSIEAVLRERGREGLTLASLRRGRGGSTDLLRSLGAFYARGGSVCWPAVAPPGRPTRLPTYPWQRERHWLEPAATNGHVAPSASNSNGNGHHASAPVVAIEANNPDAIGDLLYQVRWELQAQAVEPASLRDPGDFWLIFEDRAGVGRSLRAALEGLGIACVSASPAGPDPAPAGGELTWDHRRPEDLRPLLDRAMAGRGRLRGVAYLRPLDATGSEEMTLGELDEAQEVGCGGLLALARELAAIGGEARLWVATVGAQPAGVGMSAAFPAQATLWGLARSIAVEHPATWGGMVDLDPDDPSADVGPLARHLLALDGEDQVAFRRGEAHVPRLARLDLPAPVAAGRLDVRPDGTYLVTGGLGDLGLKAARWLVGRGARRLVLLGRRGLPARGTWDDLPASHRLAPVVASIRAMEREGATVVVAPVDVADEGRMAALFDRIAGMLPPVRGIVHAAGVAEAGAAGPADNAAFAAVLRPKVAGTWVLHRLARSLPLDFFVNFSSVAAVMGGKDAAYAAANRFLDAFAGWAAGRGVPTLTVGWGPWAGDGMATGKARAHRLLGLEPLAADRAFDALGRLGDSGLAHAVVADFDWFTFRLIFDRRGPSPLLRGIEERPRAEATPSAPRFDLELSRTSSPAVRREQLVGYFRDRVAGVLRLDPGRVDLDRPLDAMGLDSLMAIELKNGVEADLGTSLPLTSLLEGPTIAQLADRAMGQAGGPRPAGPTAGALAVPAEGPAVGHPLSPGQRSLWTLHQRTPTDAAYNMAGAARLLGEPDVDALRRSIQALVDRHASLRTTFAEVDEAPVQLVHASAEAWFRAVDVAGLDDAGLAARLAEEARRPFDLEAGPLFRTTLFSRPGLDHHLVFSMHHIVGDFWSIAVLLDDLTRLYPAARRGEGHIAAGLPAPGLAYSDFARWQAGHLAGPEGDRLHAYWADRLAGPLPVLDLPTDRPRPAIRSHRGATRDFRVDAGTTRGLAAVGASHGASLYVTLLAAFQVLLGRLSGQQDVIVGSPVAGRNRAGLEGVVGYFANPLPIRSDLSGDPSFGEFLGRVRAAVFGGLEHQDLPFAEMVGRHAAGRDPGRPPLFQAMFAFQKAQKLDAEGLTPFVLRGEGARLDLGEIPLESVAIDLGISQFDLTLSMAEVDGGLAASIESSTDLFDPATIDRMVARLRVLLGAIVAGPGRRLSALAILPDGERDLVVNRWNATESDFPRDTCLHRQIEAQAARDSGAIAVAFEDRRLTYGELNARANRLARHLRSLGVVAEARVGLCVERSDDLIVGLLGILKAGGAYVPLDPEYPPERLAFLVGDSGISVIVAGDRLLDRLPENGARVVRFDADRAAIDRLDGGDLDGGAALGHAAYVIYTSGSTGRPKGVTVTHRNLAHSTAARAIHYREPVDCFLLLASFAHDTSVAGVFWTLSQGGRLVIPTPGTHADPDRLTRLVAEHRVTHWNCVPSLLRVILAESPAARMESLRVLFLGGEVCPRDLVTALRDRLPRVGLHNEYGPTEASVWCTVHACGPEDGAGPVPIGRPIAHTRVYVLDDRLGPAPIGVAGELYVGGEGVARGYLNRPGLTADRFVPDPFGPTPGARLYRTGDLARWRPDGLLEFLGRVDDQVKVRGFRIELGEVEATLIRHPAIREVAATAREDTPGEVRLVAYLVTRDGSGPTSSELRAWLRRRVPDSLIPSVFVAMEALPASPNGKVDRKALPAPGPSASLGGDAYEPPRNEAEEVIGRLAAGLLGRDRVGLREDFFDLGIDSILAIQLVSRARQAGLGLDPGQVFEHPTVAGLAAVAARPGPESTPITATVPGSEDEYPLAPMQEGMLFHSTIAPESGVYVQQFTCPIAGELQVEAFEGAWREVIARHPVLRTSFEGLESGRPRQVVHRSTPLPIEHRDWGGSTPAEADRRLADYLREDRDRGFDPARPPLLRLALIRSGPAGHRLVLSNHHALMDGWCVPILLGEVLACYEATLAGRPALLPPTRPYRDYIDWLRSRDASGDETYWRRELRGFRQATPIAVAAPAGEAAAGSRAAFEERTVRLSKATTAALRALGPARRLTLGTIVQGAWALLLGRYAGRQEVVFGTTVSGRPPELAGVESMVGLFINTLPARVALPEDAELAGWLGDLQARLVELRRHQATPLVRVRGWAEIPRGRSLFESIVVVANTPDDPEARARAARLGIGEIRAYERTNFPMTLTAVPGARLALTASYDPGRFDGDAVGRMLGHLAHLLAEMAASPESRLGDLSLSSPDAASEVPGRRPRSGVGRPHPAELDRLSEEEVDALIAELSSDGGAPQ